MNVQRALGFALIVLQAAALGYCFRTTGFSVVMIGVASVGWLSNLRPATPENTKRWVIALVVMYIVQRTIVPQAWYSGAPSFLLSDSCLIAEHFLVFQVAQFFVRRANDQLPSYLPILAMVTFTFTGDFRAAEQARVVFQLFSIVLIALTAAYFAAGRVQARAHQTEQPASRRLLLGIVLLASGALGWVAASNLYGYSRQLEMLLASITDPQDEADSAGFSGNGRLGSVARQKANAGRRVALRVYADDSPGYLRGRAFTTYSRTEWHADSERITLSPEPDANSHEGDPTKQGDLRTFSLIQTDLDACDRLEIWPNQPFREFVFVPLGLAALQIPVDNLSIDVHGIIETDDLPSGTAYVALRTTENVRSPDPIAANEYAHPLPQTDWELLTALPEDLDPRILALATSVAGQATTTSEKIAVVEQYFQDNYEYQFGIDIPRGSDPLTYFLLEKPPAHCEYFASGAAILLRAAGVPCRYVTGFVAAERNDFGDYWVARNRDAHAWVEAFDPEQGWVVVEATPAGGVPQTNSASTASQMWDSVRAQWQRLIASVRQDSMRAVLGWLVRWFGRPWFLAVVLLIVAGVALRWLWRRRGRKPAQPSDPCLGQLQELLKAMDQRWRKAGVARQPHETYHQFAERMTSTTSDPAYHRSAQWYRQYATIRFSGQVDTGSVQMLQDSFARLAED
jgi:protein-glutamine gamma-glutamyltransferase